MRRRTTTRTIATVTVRCAVWFTVWTTVPSTVHATNPTVADRVETAMRERRYADAVTLLDELDRADGPSLHTRWMRAQALLLGGRSADADAAGAACVETAMHTVTPVGSAARADCLRIRERAQSALRDARATEAVIAARPAPTVTVRHVVTPPARRTVRLVGVPERSYAPPAGAVVLLSVGGAAMVTGAVFAAMAASATAACDVQGTTATCQNADDLARARTSADYATGANVALGVGGALLVGSAVWWVSSALRVPTPVAVTVSTDSVGIAGRF